MKNTKTTATTSGDKFYATMEGMKGEMFWNGVSWIYFDRRSAKLFDSREAAWQNLREGFGSSDQVAVCRVR